MPTYMYRDSDDEIWERVFPAGEAPKRITITEGNRSWFANRDYAAEARGVYVSVKGSSNPVRQTWPMPPCAGSGVNAAQGPELAKYLKDRGCLTEVIDGDPVYTSAAHRRKALKIRGLVDKSSFL